MPEPLFSVIINTYNYGHFIEGCIESVLAQDFPADQMEILVVDDGSTDDTAERVRKFGARVQYFYKENGDYASAMILGFQHAKGELIALLDADDLWLPNKLSRVAQEFDKCPHALMVYHKYLYWDSRDGSSWEEPAFAEISGNVLADRGKLLTYTASPTSALVFRKNAFQRMIDVPLDRGFMYDTFLFTAVLFLGTVACVPEVLSKYRFHGHNRWSAGRGVPEDVNVRRRIARRKVTNEILRGWIWENSPKSLRPQARILLGRSRLILDCYEAMLAPPNRFREFRYARRRASLEYPSSRLRHAYRLVHAFAQLVVGKRANYLNETVIRLNNLRRRRSRRTSAEQPGQATGGAT